MTKVITVSYTHLQGYQGYQGEFPEPTAVELGIDGQYVLGYDKTGTNVQQSWIKVVDEY